MSAEITPEERALKITEDWLDERDAAFCWKRRLRGVSDEQT
jgi:hypothetical protein